MKRAVFAGLAVAALAATPVLAADMPLKAPPPVAPLYNWTGCYVGTNVGGTWGQSSHHTDGFTIPGTAPIIVPAENITGDPIKIAGVLGGLQAGCQYHAGFFLIGIEGDGAWASVRGDRVEHADFAPIVLNNCPFVSLTSCPQAFAKTEERWLATARARVGFTFSENRGLFYVTGGGAWAGVRASTFITGLQGALPGEPFAGAHELASATATLSGWTVGGGLEWVLLGGITGKIEYLYVQLNHKLFFEGFVDPSILRNVDLRQHIARIGLNYRFTPGYGY